MRSTRMCAAAVCALTACGDVGIDAVGMTLRFVDQPGAIVAGQAFRVSVEIVGTDGRRVISAQDPVTLVAADSSALGGTTSVIPANGLAIFTGVALTRAEPAQHLIAASNRASATSASFAVAAGTASATHSSIAPMPGRIEPDQPVPLTITFRDVYDNAIASAPVSLTTDLSGATLTPSGGLTGATGAFASTLRASSIGTATIAATVSAVRIAFLPAFEVMDFCAPSPLSFPGVLTGTLQSRCIVDGRPTATFSFATAATVSATFTVNAASFNPTIEVTTDPPGTNLVPAVSGLPFTADWLLPPGAYLFRVGATSGVGAYSVTSSTTAGDVGCRIRTLVTGGTYTGTALASSDCINARHVFADVFAIQDSRPCAITLVSPSVNVVLSILDPANGHVESFISLVGFGSGVRIERGSCRMDSGPIWIEVSSVFAGEVGPYTFTVTVPYPAPSVERAGAR